MVIKRIHRRLDGRGSAEPDEAVGPHEDGAAIGHAGLGRIKLRICGVDNRNKFIPARAEMFQARCRAEHDQMVTRTPKAVAGRKALSRCWSIDNVAGLTDERASRVRDIEHQPSAHSRQVLRRIARRQGQRTATLAHRDEPHHKAVDLIRHLQHVAVGKSPLGRVAAEQ